MDYSVTKTNKPVIADAFSLFDEQFSITDLQNSMEKSKEESDAILSEVRKAIRKAMDSTNDEEESIFVVDIDASVKDAIKSGKIKLDTNASGEIFAQLRGEKGRYGKKLPIKEELNKQGISIEAAELALQMDAIRDQLKEIIGALKSVEGRVTEILQGQQNDRLGLFYSGLSLYLEARSVKDDSFKRQIEVQALKALSDASFQMIQELRSSVEYLVTKRYRGTKNITAKIEEHLSRIHNCYDIVYRATILKAAIYYENGEISAMLTAIDEYRRFVENLMVPNAGRLSELDRNSYLIDKGPWGEICRTLLICRELKEQISQKHVYYLSLEGVSDGNR